MRDAFGGSFMIKLLIVFIVLYISFTAIALNYAKAFKVKNKVIQYIEDNEITDINNMNAKARQNMKEYIQKDVVENMQYSVKMECPKSYTYCQDGVIIIEHDASDGKKIGTYYTIITGFGWNIPFLNALLKFNDEDGKSNSGLWTISGETRTIVKSE